MNLLLDWLLSPLGRHLLEALGHSLWLGALLVIGLRLLLRVLPAERASLRYGALLGGQISFVFLVLFTWALLSTGQNNPSAPPVPINSKAAAPSDNSMVAPKRIEASPPASANVQSAGATSAVRKPPPHANRIRVGIALVWLAGATLILSWRLTQMLRTRRLAAKATPIEKGPWRKALDREMQNFRDKRTVALKAVAGLASPGVLGFLRPVILIPSDLLDHPDARVMRAVILHELAHLRRLDPLARSLQYLIEALLFFNPFVWLLSKWIELEREAACDRQATESLDPSEYSQVLLDLVQRPGCSGGTFAAADPKRPSQLRRRIGLLLEPGRTFGHRFPFGSSLAALALAALFIVGTHKVAVLAAETLSHAERIDRIEAAAFDRLPGSRPIPAKASMKLAGKIYSPDGEPAEAIIAKSEIRSKASGAGNSLTYNTEATSSYQANLPLWRQRDARPATLLDRVDLHALAPGFTPAQKTGIPAEPGERTIDLHLKPAIAASIRVVDHNGKPIPDALIRYDYLLTVGDPDRAPSPIRSPEQLTTDENGLVHWAAPEDFPIRFDVSADGFLDLHDRTARFTKADASEVLTLSPGETFAGRVIDAETSEGIAGARIQHLASLPHELHPGSSWHSEERIATTDTEGRFSTQSLEAGGRHWLVAHAPGYLAAFPGAIDGREAEIFDERFTVSVDDTEPATFRMIPQQPVRIEITPPRGMQPESIEPYIDSKLWVTTKNTAINPWTSRLKNHSRTISEDGKRLIIETTPAAVAPIRVKLKAPGRPSRTIRGWDYGADLKVDFREAPASGQDDTLVHVTFALPPDAAPPRGEIVIHWQKGERHYDAKSFPVDDGEVRAYVDRLPGTPVTVFSRGMIGYYFPPHTRQAPENGPVRFRIQKLLPAGAVRLRIDGRSQGTTTMVRAAFADHDRWQAILQDYPTGSDVVLSPHYITAKYKSDRPWNTIPVRPLDYPFRLAHEDENVFITPLPLGEPVVFHINQGLNHLTSKHTLTAKNALLDLELELPEGIRFTGTLLDKDGAPLAGREVSLIQRLQHPDTGRIRGYVFRSPTDASGKFAFEGINPDSPAQYNLELDTETGSRVLATDIDIYEPFSTTLELAPANGTAPAKQRN